MKNTHVKRLFSLLLGLVAVFSLIVIPPATAVASNSAYDKTDSFTWTFGMSGHYRYEYPSPYEPLLTWDAVGETYWERTGVNLLYNSQDPSQTISVYCVDEYVNIVAGTEYEQMNLEDSVFFDDTAAARLRSIMLKSFPTVDTATLGAAAGVSDLTVGEAVHATQLAIWQVAYGSALHIEDFIYNSRVWFPRSLTKNYDLCAGEFTSGYASMDNDEYITGRVTTVYNYLLSLPGTAPSQPVVSQSSFTSYSNGTSLSTNEDGSYNVSASVTVDVILGANDKLTLSAVLGEHVKTYELVNGSQTFNISFTGVSRTDAYSQLHLAIDGNQTVSDVFMYAVEGGRWSAQSTIGYNSYQTPVHAEISIEPQRIIYFFKTDKILIGTEEDGTEIYDYIPLEGIIFDIYYVMDWNSYVNGLEALTPQDEIDPSALGEPVYTVTTDESGRATVNLTQAGLPDGVYAVVEREHSAIVEPTPPFYVVIPYFTDDDWEYEITIQPKNDVKGDVRIVKDVIRLDNNLASVDAARNHLWIVSTSVPADMADGKEYIITDTLDNRLDYRGNMSIYLEYAKTLPEGAEPIEPLLLIEGSDYTVTVTDNDSLAEGKPSDSFVIEFTKEGMVKVGEAVGEACDDYMIRTYYDAQINANAVVAELIPNQAFLKYRNSVNYVFDVESDIPEVYTCGISLYKHAAGDELAPLSGASFRLAREISDPSLIGSEGIESLQLESGTTIYVEYVDFYTTRGFTGEAVSTVTTDENGEAVLYGLAEGGNYYLVEVQAPNGYNRLPFPVAVTLDKVSHIGENLVYDSEGNIASDARYTLKISNSSGYEMPSTGGMGTGAYYLCGAALCMAGLGLLMLRRKKKYE